MDDRRKKVVEKIVTNTIFIRGNKRQIFGYDGSQAVTARPSGKRRLKRRLRRSEVAKV
jgi:hypothetical protein